MPGLDGKGPRGAGPMTGRCQGVCMLKIPRVSSEPVTGYAGRSGSPVHISREGARREILSLRERIGQIEAKIEEIEKALESAKGQKTERSES